MKIPESGQPSSLFAYFSQCSLVNKYLSLLCAWHFLSTGDAALSVIHVALLSQAEPLRGLGQTSTQINVQMISQ